RKAGAARQLPDRVQGVAFHVVHDEVSSHWRLKPEPSSTLPRSGQECPCPGQPPSPTRGNRKCGPPSPASAPTWRVARCARSARDTRASRCSWTRRATRTCCASRAARPARRASRARLLPELAGTLGVPIPRFAFTAPNPLGPGSFCCYPIVPGESLDEEDWHARGLLDEPETARRVAELIEAIHAFPVERARELAVQEVDLRAEHTRELPRVHGEVVPLLPPYEARQLVAAYERYLGDDGNFAVPPTLIHADLSLDHLLVDGPRITGLIDFGDVRIG